MNFKTKTILVILFSTLFLFTTSALLQADNTKHKALLGKWEVEADAGGQVFYFTFEFTLEGDELKGQMSFEMGEGEMNDIVFDGKNLTFTVSLDANGQVMEIDGDGEIDGDKISGNLNSDMGTAPYSGEKVKE